MICIIIDYTFTRRSVKRRGRSGGNGGGFLPATIWSSGKTTARRVGRVDMHSFLL